MGRHFAVPAHLDKIERRIGIQPRSAVEISSGVADNMHMVIDVFRTIAVIAVAFGAVAEIQVRVLCVGFAAYGAFVVIAFVFHLFFNRFFIMYGFW